MESIVQNIILAARTVQGITPIFAEYALWIAIIGLFAFAVGEVLAHVFRYKDKRIKWISEAFGVHSSDILAVASASLMGRETPHPATKARNPFRIPAMESPAHQADYIVRGAEGVTFVSIYNWRGTRSKPTPGVASPGHVECNTVSKTGLFLGFVKQRMVFSPDEQCKSKAATLSAALVSKFGSDASISSMCLHKNRPPKLVTRSPKRDIHGRLSPHVDIEQIKTTLPTGRSGEIDDETWRDLSSWIRRQPSRMTSSSRVSARILVMLALLWTYSQTESSTISPFEINILQDHVRENIFGITQSPQADPP
jgi:hypothetical protein